MVSQSEKVERASMYEGGRSAFRGPSRVEKVPTRGMDAAWRAGRLAGSGGFHADEEAADVMGDWLHTGWLIK